MLIFNSVYLQVQKYIIITESRDKKDIRRFLNDLHAAGVCFGQGLNIIGRITQP
jgi:hypothetical protein